MLRTGEKHCRFLVALILLGLGQFLVAETEVSAIKNKKDFYDALRDLLDFISKTQKNKDQFNFDQYQLKEDSVLIKCDAFLSEIIISGFSSFNYKFIQEGPSTGTNTYKFSLITSYDELRLIANNYRLNLNILTMLPLYGEGRAGILLGDVKSILNVTIGETKQGYITINNITIDFDLPKIATSFTGLLNTEAQSDMISSVLSFILPNVLNDLKPWALVVVNPVLKFLLNQQLAEKKITLQFIIDFIETYI